MKSISKTSVVVKAPPCFTKKNYFWVCFATLLSRLYFEGITTVPASPQEKM